jgi:hypothetical protein
MADLMRLYVIDACHKDAVLMGGVPVDDGLADQEIAIPAEGCVVEVNGKLLCFVPEIVQ